MSKPCEADVVAIVGAGLIGRAWAIVFARAACNVRLHDRDEPALEDAKKAIEQSLDDLKATGLITDPSEIISRIRFEASLGRAVQDVCYVQECGPEDIAAKRALFSELEAAAPEQAILASSSSGIMASEFASHLSTAERCLVAHPVNPPFLIPLVELSPGLKTSTRILATAHEFLTSVGQVPVTLNREIPGFVLNRLQGALLNEALNLVQSGYIEPTDLDKTVKHGLGLRWAFMGPLETVDLNAPGGIRDYAARYGPLYRHIAEANVPTDWSGPGIEAVAKKRRQALPLDAFGRRQRWRDRQLMRLVAHLSNVSGPDRPRHPVKTRR